MMPNNSLLANSTDKLVGTVFAPALDVQVFGLPLCHGFDEPLRQLDVGDEWDSEICCHTSDDVIVGEFFLLRAFWNIYNQVKLLPFQILRGVWAFALQRPVQEH